MEQFGDADAIYFRLIAYLKALGAHEAEKIFLLGDGAPWIWNRAAMLISEIGIDQDKVVQILDNCHAVGKLSPIAESAQWTSTAQKKRWLKDTTSALRIGDIETVIENTKNIHKAEDSGDINNDDKGENEETKDPVLYFERNKERMRYGNFKKLGYPIGSGGIESAIRRVINLRIKAPAKFWLKENAEHMLRMRSFLKAGRFDDLFRWSTMSACSWWRAPPDLLNRAAAAPARTLDDKGCAQEVA
jgi:hypothetical protein